MGRNDGRRDARVQAAPQARAVLQTDEAPCRRKTCRPPRPRRQGHGALQGLSCPEAFDERPRRAEFPVSPRKSRASAFTARELGSQRAPLILKVSLPAATGALWGFSFARCPGDRPEPLSPVLGCQCRRECGLNLRKSRKTLIDQRFLAVEAVISELVSARLFPVVRENTAKFADFSLEMTIVRRLRSGNSIAYHRIP